MTLLSLSAKLRGQASGLRGELKNKIMGTFVQKVLYMWAYL